MDELIKYRGESGDSYRVMCGALYPKFKDPRKFVSFISATADLIREACGVEDWNSASEWQLKYRDRIHDRIAVLSDVTDSPSNAVKLGLARASHEISKSDDIAKSASVIKHGGFADTTGGFTTGPTSPKSRRKVAATGMLDLPRNARSGGDSCL